MRKIVLLSVVLSLVIAFNSVVFAAVDGVKNSPHNLSSTTGTNQKIVADNEDQICVFCHTPHNAVVDVPLWNRTNPGGSTFSLYGGSTTIDGTITTDLTGTVSLMCLSCHDGSTALNSYGGGSSTTFKLASDGTVVTTVSGNAALGSDLTNDHPINIVYDSTTDTELVDKASLPATIDLFDGDTVQCGSCHDVHNYGSTADVQPFLRVSNTASGLCTTCHEK